jgi:hypothetical protein
MIKTNIGNVDILINGQSFDYEPIKLPNVGKQYKVDGRYKVVVDNIAVNDETVIECILQNQNTLPLKINIEPGEDLALLSFMIDNMKLSIGVQGDIPGILYDYLNDRLRIRLTKDASIMKFDINIAWITMDNIEKEKIYTWFAADPTLE